MSGRPSRRRVEGIHRHGLSWRPLATAAERIIRLLQAEDFKDHLQVLMPDCVNDLGRGVRDGGAEDRWKALGLA
jgi:hypothetical protein